MEPEALEILKTFTLEEIQKFEKFVRCDYFNNSEVIIEFANFLLSYCTDKSNSIKELTTKTISEHFKKPESTIRDWYQKLVPVLEKYLAQNRFESYRYNYKSILIEELHTRSITTSLEKNIKILEQDLNSFHNFHQSDFLIRFLIENIRFEREYLWKTDEKKKDIQNKIDQTIIVNNYLFLYYYSICSETLINLITYFEDLPAAYDNQPLIIFIREMKNQFNKIVYPPILNDFYKKILYLYDLEEKIVLKKNLFEDFDNYRELLKEIVSQLDIDERYNAFSMYQYLFPEILENFEYHKKEIEFYDEYFKQKAYKNSGQDYITLRAFRFFIVRGDSVQSDDRYKWTDKLLKNYISALKDNHENIRAIRNAYLYIREKKYRKAIDELNKISKDIRELTIIRDIDYLFIITFFEMEDFDGVKHHLNNLKRFLKKENLPDLHHESYTNFIDFASQLKKIIKSQNYTLLLTLNEEIGRTRKLAGKGWLLEKIKELITNKIRKKIRL